MLTRHRLGATLTRLTLVAAAVTVSLAPTHASSVASWQQWLHLPGVFDIAGPRSDGRLVAAVHSKLVLIDPSGTVTDFAPAYAAPDGSESYIALSPGLTVDGSSCSFARDDLYALDLRTSKPGIVRIHSDGSVSALASVPGVATLGGITFDTVGDFGHRLLVTGTVSAGKTAVAAVDCAGTVTSIGVAATGLEGGIAVAPRGFGRFGGQLIAPNEVDGTLYAVSATGQLSTVAASGVPSGPDTGVESVGFYPASGSATAYVADRGTAGNPHPGTDSVLRLDAAALAGAGVRAGDLLAATEGSDTLVDVRCTGTCTASTVANGPPPAHGEGRLLFVAAPATTSTSIPSGAAPALTVPVQATGQVTGDGRNTTAVIVAAVAAAAIVCATAALVWRRSSRSSVR